MNQAKILHDIHGICHSPCTVGCDLAMWEDDAYRTSQSDGVDTSPSARQSHCIPFPANQVFHVFDLLLIAIPMAVLVFFGRVLAHTVIC